MLDAVDVVRERGPRDVLVTSVLTSDAAPDHLDVVAVSDAGAWAVTTPLLPISPNGCGDLNAALYLAHMRSTGSPATALGRTTASVYAVLERTLEAGTRDIQLVAAQDSIAQPAETFDVRRVR